MKLGGHKVVTPDCRTKLYLSVPTARRHIILIIGRAIIGMYEIDIAAFGSALENRGVFLELNSIPTHMGHLEALTSLFHSCRETDHFAGDQPQTLMTTKLFTLIKEHLHTDTDTEQQFASRHMLQQRLDETTGTQIFDAIAESANASRKAPTPGRTILSVFSRSAGLLLTLAA
jgi:hypothetical protein